MHGASHNLEVSKRLLVIKNIIIIKERKINCNYITEGLEYEIKKFALNPIGSGKFCVKNDFVSEIVERNLARKYRMYWLQRKHWKLSCYLNKSPGTWVRILN